MTAVTLYSAEDTLDRLLTIVQADRLIHGEYISDTVDQERIDAPCGGHRACAIGSLVLAAGFTIDPDTSDIRADQDPGEHLTDSDNVGSWPNGRLGFMERHPEVGRAYSALNQAAAEYAYEHELTIGGTIVEAHGELETLFESGDLGDDDGEEYDHLNMPPTVTDAMSDIVQRAQRILAKDAA